MSLVTFCLPVQTRKCYGRVGSAVVDVHVCRKYCGIVLTSEFSICQFEVFPRSSIENVRETGTEVARLFEASGGILWSFKRLPIS